MSATPFDVDIEVTNGGAYLTIAGQEIDLSYPFKVQPEPSPDDAVLWFEAVEDALRLLVAKMPAALAECAVQRADLGLPCDHCGGDYERENWRGDTWTCGECREGRIPVSA
jgi:hypothetical protein